MRRDGIRKAKVQLELNLAKEAKPDKKGFHRYVDQIRKIKENVPTLVNKTRELVTNFPLPQKAEVLNTILPQFSTIISLPTFLKSLKLEGGPEGMKSFPS